MRQTALLEFESSNFAIVPGEDEQTNPGVYGQSLARWIAQQLAAHSYAVGEIIAEDFGWCVPIKSDSPRLFVACASVEENPNHWRVFAFAEGGTLARLFGKDKSAELLASLYVALKQVLQSEPNIKALREETA